MIELLLMIGSKPGTTQEGGRDAVVNDQFKRFLITG